MYKLKIIALFILCFIPFILIGCEHEEPIPNLNNSALSSEVTKPSKKVEIPVMKEYSTEVEDAKVNVSISNGKINQNLQDRIINKEIVELKDGECIDLNNDNIGEVISLKIEKGKSNSIDNYMLTVGNRQIEDSGSNLTEKFYAARLGAEWNGVQLLIEGEGPSCDPFCDIFHYENDRLWKIGTVYCHADSITIKKDGFSGYKRGSTIQTWYRPADYILATDCMLEQEEKEYIPPRIAEVPRDIYPMGTIVKLKCDLPLQLSKTNSDTNIIIKEGLNVVLAATDDVEWIYITPTQNEYQKYPNGGWLRIKPNSFDTCMIDGKEISAYDIFQGLNCAD